MIRYRFAIFILLILSVGCTKQVRPEKEVVKKDASLEELLNLYQMRLEAFDGFKALMEVRTDSPKQGRHTFQGSWVSSGDETRVLGLTLFGGTLFDLRLAGSAFSLTIPSERRAVEADLDEMEEVFDQEIPLGSVDLLEWVRRGGIPELLPPLVPALEKGEDLFILYRFAVDDGKGVLREKIWIERTAFWVQKVETFDPGGRLDSVVMFDDYRGVGRLGFPHRVVGESRGEKVELRFKEVSPLSEPGP